MKKDKKIILVVISLLLAILVITAVIYKYKKANTKDEANINIAKEKDFSNEIESTTENVLENSVAKNAVNVQNIANTEVVEKANTKEESTENNITVQEPKKSTVQKEEKAEKQESTPVVQAAQEVVSSQAVSINKPVDVPKIEAQATPEIPEVTKAPIVQETVVAPAVPTEEYRYNDAMTQTIVNIINSNPSEFMKQDGFNVVVDSSITSLTNQFTFTEERVKNKVLYKAGTIKVYAQDYYCNGELLFTECYIF